MRRTLCRYLDARVVALAALWGVGLVACEDPYPDAPAPIIVEVRPAAAEAGRSITIIGRRFGLRSDRDQVSLGGDALEVESWTDTAVLARLPERAPGVADIVIRAGPFVSAPHPFEVLGSEAPPPAEGGGAQ